VDEAVIDGGVYRIVRRRLGVEFPRCRIEGVSECSERQEIHILSRVMYLRLYGLP